MGLFRKKRDKLLLEPPEDKDYESMLVKHRKRMRVVVVLLILLAAVLTVIVKVFLDHRAYETYEVTGTIKLGDTTKCKFYRYGEGVLRYSNDGISYLAGGEEIWNQAFEMKAPVVDVCEEYMAIADMEGTKIYIFNLKGKQGEVETTSPILGLEVARQGEVAAITQSDETNKIEIYDREGVAIAMGQTLLSGDGCPLDISLSNDGTKLAVSYLYIEGGTAKTKVIFYNYSEVGKNEVGRVVGGFQHYGASIVSKVEFISNNIMVAIGDDVISFYEVEEKPSLKKEYKLDREIKSLVFSENYVGVILNKKETMNQSLLAIYGSDGKEVNKLDVAFEYEDVQIDGKKVIFSNQQELYILTVDGLEKFKGVVEGNILKAIPGKWENVYMVIGEKEAQEIRLK